MAEREPERKGPHPMSEMVVRGNWRKLVCLLMLLALVWSAGAQAHPFIVTCDNDHPCVTFAPLPKCDQGWTLVMDSGGRPMCAKELKEPQH
jgi:hypothetical protein